MFIQVPSTPAQWQSIANDFNEKWGFPNCVGAIDGKHVAIRAPDKSGSVYFNYKYHFSIVLKALVDANYRIVYCDVGSNGRISDGGVFAACTLNLCMMRNSVNFPIPQNLPGTELACSFHVVADEAFPLRADIMKPFPVRNLSRNQRIFNYRLSRARRVVENAFGILVNRFRVLMTTINLSPSKVEHVVMASCVLHNYIITQNGCLDHNSTGAANEMTSELIQYGSQLTSVKIPHNNNSSAAAKRKRDMLMEYFCTPSGELPWQYSMI